jgi:hypothetical protein
MQMEVAEGYAPQLILQMHGIAFCGSVHGEYLALHLCTNLTGAYFIPSSEFTHQRILDDIHCLPIGRILAL